MSLDPRNLGSWNWLIHSGSLLFYFLLCPNLFPFHSLYRNWSLIYLLYLGTSACNKLNLWQLGVEYYNFGVPTDSYQVSFSGSSNLSWMMVSDSFHPSIYLWATYAFKSFKYLSCVMYRSLTLRGFQPDGREKILTCKLTWKRKGQ